MVALFSGANEADFAVGVFRTIRVFIAKGTYLTPVTYFNAHKYEKPFEWYNFVCTRHEFDRELIAKALREHHRWPEKLPIEITEMFIKYKTIEHPVQTLTVFFKAHPSKDPIQVELLWQSEFVRDNFCEQPSASCSCGFYSFYNVDYMLASQSYWMIDETREFVFGVVENSGLVLHGTRGIRAQRMRILGIATSTGTFIRPENYPLAHLFPWYQYVPHLLAKFPLDKPPI